MRALVTASILRRRSRSAGRRAAFAVALVISTVALGCDHRDASLRVPPKDDSPAAATSCGGHTACARDFVVDAEPAGCAAGTACALVLRVTALGDFHINEEYPYRFKASDASRVTYLGTDAAGKNVFSKGAGDWKRTGEKTGAMTVRFTAPEKGDHTVAGLLKLSVCSPQSCLLDQREIAARVRAD